MVKKVSLLKTEYRKKQALLHQAVSEANSSSVSETLRYHASPAEPLIFLNLKPTNNRF